MKSEWEPCEEKGMKDVILVESPTKAKTLTKFLKGKYDVVASMGHIRDLPKSKLGVEIEKNFEPQYIIPRDKLKTVKLLKETVKGTSHIILATDPDREGEAIAFHLHEILKDKAKKDVKFSRIVFHEITQGAIDEAMTHTRNIDQDLVNAQTARRVLDRVVGYKLSPLLWKKVKRHLSAGRVQSVALRLIVEREKEIGKFESKTFYRIFIVVTKKGDATPIEFELSKINGEKIQSSTTVELYDGTYKYASTSLSKEEAEDIIKAIEKVGLTITSVESKETKRSPYPPFTTSTLQQAAIRRFSYTGKRTMSLAQRLYEEGYITYHRTDSFNLSNVFLKDARGYIEKEFGKEYLSSDTRVYKTSSKSAQEAHEAIRPTDLTIKKSIVEEKLGKDFANVYDLVFRRAVATQMNDAIFASTRVEGEIEKGKIFTFGANGRILKFPGFLKLYAIKDDGDQILPEIKVGEILDYKEGRATEHQSAPPPRYNEASLISSLEKHGIGRPSTYAPIISTLYDRFYVEKTEGKLIPTEIGISVSEFLVKNFGDIDDIPFTAAMEGKLDEIAEGKLEWVPMLKEFYKPFEEDLIKAEGAEKIEIVPEYSDKMCPKDNGRLIIRQSRFGKFLSCENFPTCDYKESLREETEYPCPKDGGKVVVKRTRKGRTFFGCGNYPKCDFAVWKKEDLLKAVGKEPETPPAETATN